MGKAKKSDKDSSVSFKNDDAAENNKEQNVGTAENLEPETDEGLKAFPKIRLRVEEGSVKAKQFATAKGLSAHLKITQAKKLGLEALYKMATWLSSKK